MARKQRRAARAASSAAKAAKPLRPAPPGIPSTFRAAQARRELVEALPRVVPNSTRDRGVSPRVRGLVETYPLQMERSDQGEAKRSPSRVKAVRAEQPTLKSRDLALKCPPKDNKPKGGAGSGRSFVPWSKNC